MHKKYHKNTYKHTYTNHTQQTQNHSQKHTKKNTNTYQKYKHIQTHIHKTYIKNHKHHQHS